MIDVEGPELELLERANRILADAMLADITTRGSYVRRHVLECPGCPTRMYRRLGAS